MNQHLKTIQDLLQQNKTLSDAEKETLLKTITEADKQWSITDFKLDRTEKVKKTTAILLEETIEELEQKRKSVEAQNRELEIESSLERVRAVAMGMKKPDDLLSICEVLFKELQNLGFSHLRNTLINTFVDEQHYFIDYDFSDFAGGSSTRIPYSGHPVIEKYIKEATKKNDAFIEMVVAGKELEDWKEFRRVNGETDDPRLDNIAALYYYNYSIGVAGIGISTFQPITQEKLEVLKRFRNVFDLAYRRYTDIQQAEAQAREAKIEAALEKVRSRSLAVHQSEEFKEVISVVFEKLQELEIPVEAASINIFVEGSKDTDVYACGRNENGLDIRKVRLRYFDHPIANDLYNAHKKGLDYFVGSYGMKEKNSYYEYQFKHADLKELPVEIKERILQAERYSLSMAPAKNSVIIINNFEGKLLSDREADVVKRFSRVFEQAYTRFLDLQKAEAQARESQIQLALERVRARTMAMQKSDELREAVLVLYEQLQQLNFNSNACNIIIIDKETSNAQYWVSGFSQEMFPQSYNVPYFNHPYQDALIKPWEEGDKYVVYEYAGKTKQSFDKIFFTQTEFRNVPEDAKKIMIELKSVMLSTAFITYGALQSLGAGPLSEENANILQRFAKVFEQTYTRFLDLQKAEAQARESQIQLALERVRARTMAMQHSDELKDAAALLFQQVKSLGVPAYSCGYNIWEKDDKEFTSWMSTQDGSDFNAVLNIPLTEDANFIRFAESRKKGEQFFVLELRGERMQEHYQYLKTIPAFKAYFDYAVSVGFDLPETQIHHLANFSQGNLLFITLEPCPEFHDVFKRFAAVFEQTYTRFLDLQNAEAQAREAQIEAALERVRSRTMAMQKSEELKEVIQVVYAQFVHLNIHVEHTGFIIDYKTRDDMHIWLADKHAVPFQVTIPYFDCPHWNSFNEAKAKGRDFFTNHLNFEEKNKFYQELFGLFPVPDEAKEYYFSCPALAISTILLDNVGLYIENFSGIPYTIEENNTLMRFGKVFQQTYTRFLDLQKAEDQAREAKIEAALERTRTQSMIMQHSKELDNTLRVFHEQILLLGIQSEFSYLWLPDEDKERHIFWAAWAENLSTGQPDKNNSIVFKSKAVNYPLDRSEPATAQCLVDWKSDESIYSYVIPPAGVENYFATWKELLEGVERLKPVYFQGGLYYVEAFMKYGCFGVVIKNELLDDEKKILLRFSVEFERTYTRFLDLQKAEGQAREAQIEAALEKIRSRSLAMHQSDELEEVIMVVSEQLQQLQFRFHNASFVRYNEQQGLNFWLASPGQPQPYLIEVPYLDNPIYTRPLEALKNGVDFIADVLTAEENHEWVAHLLKYSVLNNVSEDDKKFLRGTTGFARSLVLTKHIILVIGNYGAVPYTDEQNQILKRFGYVFEQAYTRFLDLLKAEAQTREAQIELGLERVRARAMAMQNSVELKELIGTVFIELTKLDIVLTRCVIMIYDTVSNDSLWWMANSEAPADPIGLRIKYHDHAPYLAYINAWREKNLKWTYVLEGGDKKSWDEFLFAETELSHLPDFVIDGMKAPDKVYLNSSFNTFGNLTLASLNPLSNEHFDIMLRFAKVFDLTYTRFNDLQKAEAQAKESQIEAALERVRSRSMAMHKSEELADLSLELVKQVQALGVATWFCAFNIYDNDPQGSLEWGSNGQGTFPKYRTPREAIFLRYYEAGQKGETLLINEIGENECPAHYDYLCTLPGVGEQLLKMKESGIPFPVSQIDHVAFFKYGYILFITYEPTPESHDIFKRFAKVFEQTYTRFLDLQKAEAQVKESQIEAALERVRSKTMAMHKTDELQGVVRVVAEELKNTGVILDTGGAVICTYFQDSKDVIHWTATEDPAHPSVPYLLPYFKDELFDEAWASKNSGDDYFAKEFSYEVKNAFFNYAFEHSDYRQLPDEYKKIMLESKSHGLAWAWSKNSAIMIPSIQGDLPSEEEKEILIRFAKVFEQSFIRFLDLQKAEAQTREATIEAALERVRGKAMAMHSSKDLATTIGVFYHELEALNLTPRRCGVGLIDKEKQTAEISTMNASADGEGIELVGNLDLRSHPVLTSVYNNWLTKTEYHPVLRGNEIKDYYQIVRPQISFPDYPNDTVQYGYFFFFEEGGVYAWTEKELNEEELKIYRRFTSVLSLTYKRYKDLKDAEVRAQTAIKDAALDRIRADIASMRTINDLDRITPLIWNELTVLGIPFIRCGVFIMDEDQEFIHTFLSTPDGRSIAAFHLPYDTPGNIGKVLDHWRNKENYIDHWDEKEFHQFAEILAKQGALDSAENYLKTIPHGGFALHFLPFLQGMLYVGNTTQLNDEQIELIQHVANAFSTAYARYEDFNKLEAAKQQVDKTLVELKQAQTQLVQSEKMASLGELTAGIAHEIQNPLNFVNNFSDVSHELLEEMKTELEKGNKEDAMAIAEDVKQNLEKILHHGKRADAIVKGMLQHSRAGSGQKELTDINALADEYLRLAYHGLRAKDKSFNAALHHDFDKSIDKVNIIPQDIGRVLVNLINNAFYAVNVKARKNIPGYEPVLTITTKKIADKVELRVSDNGIGIPPKVLDKIFHPFFTTKPTGQGTGLGLSMAYDIITKGHGGELKVKTKEGEGSEFCIQIPVSKTPA